MTDFVPLDLCKDGYLYRISSRNLTFGVFKATTAQFYGIREKLGARYIFGELHRECGPPCGTVWPLEEIEKAPISVDDEDALFLYLEEVEKSYATDEHEQR